MASAPKQDEEPELDAEGQPIDPQEEAYYRALYRQEGHLARAERLMREHMVPNGDRLVEIMEKFE